MNKKELFEKFHEIATHPETLMKRYIDEGKPVVLVAPVYTPEEIIHSMGCVPMGAWGADIQLNEAKRYFPAFICSIVQSILELGMKGVYKGASALVVPSLCDSLKCLGENWKYGVKDIPFIPMTYPQNRKPGYGHAFTKAGYERLISDLEKAAGKTFDDGALGESIRVYNDHNQAMRDFATIASKHPEVSASERSDVFKSATFMEKSEHTKLVRELIAYITEEEPAKSGTRILISGILADSPALNDIIDELGFTIAADDVAAQSRQYTVDAPDKAGNESNLDALVNKFCNMDNCSVLYDPDKKRVNMITNKAAFAEAQGVVVILTKFCDPEEFDYPLIKKACDERGLPCVLIEVDRQMENMEQARTMLQALKEMI
ncbi:MAG: 2-hydroxyacyl-CoA dehydratase [Lachnospiraceae bacterium]|nr:2-hydroxyacyl-CoA dehydratase [Lachnospiraceae bacterium]